MRKVSAMLQWILSLAMLLLCCDSLRAAIAADAPAKPKVNPLDDLSDPLLDDLKNLPTPKKPRAEAPKPAISLKARLKQELTGGEDIGEEEQNPLIRIGRRMKLVEELIGDKDTAAETQQLQKLIRDELAELVEQAKKQGSGGGNQRKPQGGKPGKPSTPMGEGTGEARASQPVDSTQRVDKAGGETTTPTDARELMRRLWGHLPEKMREEMQNAQAEQFLPKYEKLIENYFRRLSEEQKATP